MRKLIIPLLALLALATQAPAKELKDYAGDARDYALAPLHWDAHGWMLAGAAVATTAAAYGVDNQVRDLVGAPAARPDDPFALRDSAPMAAMIVGTFTAGWFADKPELTNTGKDMIEAVVLSTAGSFALKRAFGRERPDATGDRNAWRSGGESFPSGHTAAAFAAAQVLADSLPDDEWGWRVVAYSMGAATAYARIRHDRHWFSDTVAGAALGMATGRFVSNRSANRGDGKSGRFSLQPLQGGAYLSYSIDPYDLMLR